MYARVSKVMAQFVIKIEKLSHIMGLAPILEMARAYGLRPRLWLLVTLVMYYITCSLPNFIYRALRERRHDFILPKVIMSWQSMTTRGYCCQLLFRTLQ